MKYCIFLILLVAGCTQPEYKPVAMTHCVAQCVDNYIYQYLNGIYSTQDKFYDQFKQACEYKMQNKYCMKSTSGYYLSKEVEQ